MEKSVLSRTLPSHDRTATVRKLAPAWQRLLACFQQVRYGRIERLQVTRGQPDLRCGIHWRRTIKIGGDNEVHPGSHTQDYVLKRECAEFVRLLSSVGDGEIVNVEIRNGLPVAFEVRGSLSEQ